MIRKEIKPAAQEAATAQGAFAAILAVFCLTVWFSLPAGAATYYVDPENGDDGNPGTLAAPLKRLTYALDIAVSGDDVLALPGLYSKFTNNESFPLVIPAGVVLETVEDDCCLTVIADDDLSPIFDSTIRIELTWNADHTRTRLEGFVLDGLDLSHNVNGLEIVSAGATTGTSPVIRRCIIQNYTGDPFLDFDGTGIFIEVSNREGNSVVTAHLDGNTIRGTDNAIMIYAVPDHVESSAVDESEIYNNVLTDNKFGIVLVTNPYEEPMSSSCRIHTAMYANTIANNTFDGISFFNWDSTTVPEFRTAVVNNILAYNGGFGIFEDGPHSDPLIVDSNDLFFNDEGLYFDEGSQSLSDVDLVNLLPEAGQGNNFIANPAFLNLPDRDYHIPAYSPCLDRADPAYVPAEDMDREERPYPQGGLADVGADEYKTTENLLRDYVIKIVPYVDPPIREILPLVDGVSPVIVPGFISGGIDPEEGILVAHDKPLAFYRISPVAEIDIVLTKEFNGNTVRIHYR